MLKKLLPFFIFLPFIIFLFKDSYALEIPKTPEQPNTPSTEHTVPRKPKTPPIKKIEFIHYPKDEFLRRRQPTRRRRSPRHRSRFSSPSPSPSPVPSPTVSPTPSPTPLPSPILVNEDDCPNPATCEEFQMGSIRWSDINGIDDQGLPYYLNLKNNQLPISTVESALKSSFLVWEQAHEKKQLKYRMIGYTDKQAGQQDFQNTISFRNINREYRGALAVTSIWYRVDTLEFIEFDIVFNSGVPMSINLWPNGCAEYPVDNCKGDLYSYDFENIAVHEIGHTLMLFDLSRYQQREMTMYGRAKRGELKKRTLGLGDKTGLNLLYP